MTPDIEQSPTKEPSLDYHTFSAESEDDVNLFQVTRMISSLFKAQMEATRGKTYEEILASRPDNHLAPDAPFYNEKVRPTYDLRMRKLKRIIGSESKVFGVYTFVDPSYRSEEVEGFRFAIYVPKKNAEYVFPSLKTVNNEDTIYTFTDIEEDLDDQLGISKVLRLITPDGKYDGYILTAEVVSKEDDFRERVQIVKRHGEMRSQFRPLKEERESILEIREELWEILGEKEGSVEPQEVREITQEEYDQIVKKVIESRQWRKGKRYDEPRARKEITHFGKHWCSDCFQEGISGKVREVISVVVPREMFAEKFPALYWKYIKHVNDREDREFPIIGALGNGNITITFPLENLIYISDYEIAKRKTIEIIKGQIWSKAMKAYALEKKREVEDLPIATARRLIRLLEYNRRNIGGEVEMIDGAEYKQWKGISCELIHDDDKKELKGVIFNVKFQNEILHVAVQREDFTEGTEERKIFECLLEGVEEDIYS